MVKNTIGGKKGKMLANKRSGSGGDKKMRLSSNDDEIYVCVSKVFGGGMFEVIDNDNKSFKAVLRGKMKGPNKRHNFVSLFSILLVGKRSDLSDSDLCDILFVYDDHDILSLSVLPIHIHNVIHFHQNHSFISNISNTNSDLFCHLDSLSKENSNSISNFVDSNSDSISNSNSNFDFDSI